MKEAWIDFIYQGEIICSYTVNGTFPGELEATKELLAGERNISIEDIQTRTVIK